MLHIANFSMMPFLAASSTTLLDDVDTALTSVIGWAGDVVTALTSSSGTLIALRPLFAIGIGVSAVFVGVKVIKGMIWGA